MTLHSTQPSILKAVLVGIQFPDQSEAEVQASLDELARLVTTLGYKVVGRMTQRRSTSKGMAVLGDGKLKELAGWTGGTGVVASSFVKKKHKAALKFEKGTDSEEDLDLDEAADEEAEELNETSESPTETADVVIFDCDLSPSQLRNLESASGVTVLDRTGVIIEIFSRHARTKAARLQVEIARLSYVAPRLRETGGGEDRQGGGVGGKGAGESSIELDRRKIRDRIKELKQELESIGTEHETRRSQRHSEFCVALVGYTNAGKSSLMRALTGSEVLVADKLFATLDTTVRSLHPESKPKILVSDTVGFIKKLPHDLVASFKSTLDEAHNASMLLFVVDSSDESFRSQLEVTRQVLSEVGVENTPSLLVLNKRDRLTESRYQELKAEFPEALFLSTRDSADIKAFRQRLIEFFETDMEDAKIFVPYDRTGAVGEIRAHMRVISESFDEKGTTYQVKAKRLDLDRIRKKFKLE
jgi:GTP-binding protein HflX